MDYDQGILAVPRRLFSQNYVDGGCSGDPPKNTTTARARWVLLRDELPHPGYRRPRRGVRLRPRARERLERAGASGVERGLAAAYAAFFALTGLGYGAAGVFAPPPGALAPPGWWAAAYVVVLLGNAGLCGVGALTRARPTRAATRGDGATMSCLWEMKLRKLGVAAPSTLRRLVFHRSTEGKRPSSCWISTQVASRRPTQNMLSPAASSRRSRSW